MRKYEEKSSKWLEGRRTLIPTTEGNIAVGDFSDVQPSGSKIISQSGKKSSDTLAGNKIIPAG